MRHPSIELLTKIASSKLFLGEGRIGTKKFAISFEVEDGKLILNLQKGEDSEIIEEKDMLGVVSCSIGWFLFRFNRLLTGLYWNQSESNYSMKEVFIRPIDPNIMQEIYKFFIEKLHNNEAQNNNRATCADSSGEQQ